jgi:hypothetical protein
MIVGVTFVGVIFKGSTIVTYAVGLPEIKATAELPVPKKSPEARPYGPSG